MTRAIFRLGLVLLLGGSSVLAQTIILKNGQQVETRGVTRRGDKVMAKIEVAGTSGEAGYDLGAIARIQFPEPRGLKTGAELLAQGQAEKALTEVTPIINFYAPFKDVPGAWWSAAAVVKVSALAALGRDAEAQPLAIEIQRNSSDPEISRAANLRIAAALVKKLDYEKAAEICDAAIKESSRPEILADAWVTKGNLLLAQKEWDSALLAFLRVPVFYQDVKLFMPPAMLGSARAYRRLDDLERARKSLNELIAAYPKSAEAALAQSELQKLPKENLSRP